MPTSTMTTTSPPQSASNQNLFEALMIALACLAGILTLAILCYIVYRCNKKVDTKKTTVLPQPVQSNSTQTSFPAASMGILPLVKQEDANYTYYSDGEVEPYQTNSRELAVLNHPATTGLNRAYTLPSQPYLYALPEPRAGRSVAPDSQTQSQSGVYGSTPLELQMTERDWTVPVQIEGVPPSEVEHYV
jgi:hypothetical protein